MEDASEPGLSVLVVDDNEDMATSLVELLKTLDCDVAYALSGPAALVTLLTFTPELVFLDLEMTGADGCEVLSDVQEKLAPRRAKYVCLTGTSDPAAQGRCTDAGFDHFVAKPIAFSALADLVAGTRPSLRSFPSPN